MEAEKDKSAEVEITKEESEVTRDDGEIASMLGDITREDLDMLDQIFTNMQINQQDNVDVEMLKQDLTKSDICSEEKKQLLLSILNDVDGDLHWTNVLDVLKVGLVTQKCPEKGKGILKRRLSRRESTRKGKGVTWASQIVEEREIVNEDFSQDTVNVPLTKNHVQQNGSGRGWLRDRRGVPRLHDGAQNGVDQLQDPRTVPQDQRLHADGEPGAGGARDHLHGPCRLLQVEKIDEYLRVFLLRLLNSSY